MNFLHGVLLILSSVICETVKSQGDEKQKAIILGQVFSSWSFWNFNNIENFIVDFENLKI